MKVICTTSDLYHHCLPIFFRQYERFMNISPFELVGYKRPENLPDWVDFVSLGEQRGPEYFTNDLLPYFKQQPQWFIWMMEDTFLREMTDFVGLDKAWKFRREDIGRIGLTNDITKREHTVYGDFAYAHRDSAYRLSTQPSIWNRDFLTYYMKPGLTPWQFEKQETIDGWKVYGTTWNVITHNEGVRKHDIHKLNLDGIDI